MSKILRRQFIGSAIAVPFVGTEAFAAASTGLVPSAPKKQKLEIVPSQYPFFDLSGTAFERGVAYGKGAKTLIEGNIDYYTQVFKARANLPWDKACSLSKRFLPFIEKAYPEGIEEMKGIAEGSGRSFEDILTLNCRSEVLFANADACTCVTALAENGQNHHVYMGQTWDWFMPARKGTCILRIRQSHKPTILMVAEAGIIGGKGLNSEGLGICLNAVSVGKGQPGVPLHIMMRNVLNSTLITEAIDCVSKVKRAGSGVFNIGSAADFAMSLEFSPDNYDIIMSEGDPIAHTNHYLTPLFLSADTKGLSSTYTRLNTIRRRIKNNQKPLNEKVLFDLLTAHNNYPNSLCTHEDPRKKGWSPCTVYTLVMDLTAGKLWITNGYACEGKISVFTL